MSDHSTPDSRYLDLLKNISFRPVFIIGDHRSGTTLLHRLLAETGCFNFVTAYHVIRYGEVLANHVEGKVASAKQQLMREFDQLGVKDRMIDATPVHPDLPVEYGFILSSIQNRRPRITGETLPRFLELCRKIQYVSGPARTLLLKNPWDVLNFREIKDRFPEARFVFIHRDPVMVINSQLRAIQTVMASKSDFLAMIAPWYRKLYDRPLQLRAVRILSRPPFRLWERLLALHTVRLAHYYMRHIGSLPAADYVSLTYEELCREPDQTMGRLMAFLGAEARHQGSWRDRIEPRPPKVLPEAEAVVARIRERIKPYLEVHGYEAQALAAKA